MSNHTAWKIWTNPIFRRYARARLRPQALAVSLILTLLVAGFIFFSMRAIAMYRSNMEVVDAERLPLLPLFFLQGFIMFLLGTGQVAGGMTGEADEGVIDYQRLTPLTPLTKVMGYLFGLPLREYVMFASTLPFTAWGLWRGQVPFTAWASLYLVFFTATILYHLTGLVAGTVVRNRRWAFLVSMGVVFVLYLVMPQVAKFGLTTFEYFTIWPVFGEQVGHFVPRTAHQALRMLNRLGPEVRFFGLSFPETVFTLFSQAGLILTFLVMVWRRWRQAESHLLGKVWSVGLMVWTQVLLLGNALPLIEPGLIFPSREFQQRLFMSRGWRPSLTEGVAMIGLYGMVGLLLVLVLASIITPTLEGQVRGRRRALKLGLPRPPWSSDAATGFWFVLALAGVAAAGWYVFARGLVHSSWFAGLAMPAVAPWAFALAMGTASLSFFALLETWGAKRVFLAVIFLGVAPLLIGATMAGASDRLITAGTWIISFSLLAGPIVASQVLLPTFELPMAAGRAIGPAFWFWQSLAAVVTVWLLYQLWQAKHRRTHRTDQASTC